MKIIDTGRIVNCLYHQKTHPEALYWKKNTHRHELKQTFLIIYKVFREFFNLKTFIKISVEVTNFQARTEAVS